MVVRCKNKQIIDDIAEILLIVALKHQQQKIKSKSLTFAWALRWFIIGIYSS
jgi:hypothetical protein